MSVNVIKDMGHSVNARLKSLAGQRGVGFDYLLLRYACERFLFRLGKSEHSSRFILKGACAFSVWFGPMFRVTRDTDFLCHGNPAPEHLVQCFRDICATEVPDDGVRFDADSIVTSEIKKDAKYRGTNSHPSGISTNRPSLEYLPTPCKAYTTVSSFIVVILVQ